MSISPIGSPVRPVAERAPESDRHVTFSREVTTYHLPTSSPFSRPRSGAGVEVLCLDGAAPAIINRIHSAAASLGAAVPSSEGRLLETVEDMPSPDTIRNTSAMSLTTAVPVSPMPPVAATARSRFAEELARVSKVYGGLDKAPVEEDPLFCAFASKRG